MNILPEDAHFKNYDQRQLNPQALSGMKRINIFLMLFLTLVTLGIYPAYWYFVKVRQINKLYPNYPVNSIFFTFFLIFYALYYVLQFLPGNGGHASGDDAPNPSVVTITSVAFITQFIMVFMMRNRINAIVGAKPRDKYWVNGWLTFFFHLYYIQYKINQIKDESQSRN